MKQLRESDIHGAPLPFQAAASNSKACFEIVCDTICKMLGNSELRTQLKVKNAKRNLAAASFISSTILHHAHHARRKEIPPGPDITFSDALLVVTS